MLPETEKSFTKAVDALNPLMLPTDMSPEYGECNIRLLADKFGIPFRTVRQ